MKRQRNCHIRAQTNNGLTNCNHLNDGTDEPTMTSTAKSLATHSREVLVTAFPLNFELWTNLRFFVLHFSNQPSSLSLSLSLTLLTITKFSRAYVKLYCPSPNLPFDLSAHTHTPKQLLALVVEHISPLITSIQQQVLLNRVPNTNLQHQTNPACPWKLFFISICQNTSRLHYCLLKDINIIFNLIYKPPTSHLFIHPHQTFSSLYSAFSTSQSFIFIILVYFICH